MFYCRSFNEYVAGFTVGSEMWIGLSTLEELTRAGSWELRVDMEDWMGHTSTATYHNFSVGPAPR